MSISALTSEAARLLVYFQNAEASIESRVNSAIAAVPNMTKAYYVDAVSGNDENAGTSTGAALATLDKALELINNGSGMRVSINLHSGQTHNLTADAYISSCVVRFYAYGNDAHPIINVGYQKVLSSGVYYASNYGIAAPNSTVFLQGDVDIKTPLIPAEDAALPVLPNSGFLRPLGSHFAIQSGTIDLGDIPLIGARNDGPVWFSARGVELIATGSAPLADCSQGTARLTFVNMTLPAETTVKDYVTGIVYSAAGHPLNVLSNVDLSE